jgi:hypothetical protein
MYLITSRTLDPADDQNRGKVLEARAPGPWQAPAREAGLLALLPPAPVSPSHPTPPPPTPIPRRRRRRAGVHQLRQAVQRLPDAVLRLLRGGQPCRRVRDNQPAQVAGAAAAHQPAAARQAQRRGPAGGPAGGGGGARGLPRQHAAGAQVGGATGGSGGGGLRCAGCVHAPAAPAPRRPRLDGWRCCAAAAVKAAAALWQETRGRAPGCLRGG